MSPTTPRVSNEIVRMQVPFEPVADMLSLSRDLKHVFPKTGRLPKRSGLTFLAEK